MMCLSVSHPGGVGILVFASFYSGKFIFEIVFFTRSHWKLQYFSDERSLTLFNVITFVCFVNCFQVSEEGRGVACISDMLMITRFHNSISASSIMRR